MKRIPTDKRRVQWTAGSSTRCSACVGLLALSLLGVGGLAPQAQAAVVEHADVAGFRTFQDSSSGRIWLDLDGRFTVAGAGQPAVASYGSYGAYRTAFEGAGFTWASTAEVQALFDTLVFPSNSSAATMGAALASVMTTATASEGFIMGIAQNSSTPTGQRRHGMVSSGSLRLWGTFASSVDFAQPDTSNPVGVWAYMQGQAPGGGGGSGGGGAVPAVPEPGSLALCAVALGGMAWLRRRAKPMAR